MKGGRVMEVKINMAEEGGSINWVDDLDEEIPPWENVDMEIPHWDAWEGKQVKPVERAVRVEKVVEIKKALRVKRVVTIKKETTHPYLMPLGSYLAMMLGEEGMRKLLKEEGVRTEKKLEEKYMRQIMREPGPCENPGEEFQTFDVTKLGEGALQRLIRGWESGPQIVSVSDGGKAQVFVRMLAMSSCSTRIITPIIKEEQASQDTGRGHSRGVKEEVRNH